MTNLEKIKTMKQFCINNELIHPDPELLITDEDVLTYKDLIVSKCSSTDSIKNKEIINEVLTIITGQ